VSRQIGFPKAGFPMRVLAMADIHGSHDLYEYVPRLADEHQAEVLVAGAS